jgi:hypothetical protein
MYELVHERSTTVEKYNCPTVISPGWKVVATSIRNVKTLSYTSTATAITAITFVSSSSSEFISVQILQYIATCDPNSLLTALENT